MTERIERVDFGGMVFDRKDLHKFDSVIKHCEYDLRLDDGQTAFLIRQLVYMMAEIKTKKYNALTAREVFPVMSNFGSGMEYINQEFMDMTGEAEIIADDAHDYPVAGVTSGEIPRKVGLMGMSVVVSNMEMRKAAFARKPLSRRKMDAALRAMEAGIDKIAFLGNSKFNIAGLFSKPSDLTSTTITADGTGSSKKWSTKDASKIERDIKAMVTNLPEPFIGEDLILVTTPANYRLLTMTRIGTDTQDTIADYLIKKTPIKELNFSSRLKSVSAISNKDTAVIYPKNPEVLNLVIPRDKEEQPVHRGKREISIDIETELSGLHIDHPKAVVYADEV
jgi:hypothetical protein